MLKPIKTPGVYIQELDAFGNSVVPVPTAIPAFIGYTEQTTFNGTNLLNKPIKVDSLAMFKSIFEPTNPELKPSITFKVELEGDSFAEKTSSFSNNGVDYYVSPSTIIHRLHSAMKFFYANGGGECYIISIGDYKTELDTADFVAAISSLKKEMEPTMLVIPDAVELTTGSTTDPLSIKNSQIYTLQEAMINHCGDQMNRVAILDVPGGFDEPISEPNASVNAFRNGVSPLDPKFNSYAVAYYPWLHTSVYITSDITYKNIDPSSYSAIVAILTAELKGTATFVVKESGDLIPEIVKILSFFSNTPDTSEPKMTMDKVDATLKNISAVYPIILEKIRDQLNLMPPSAAMAGIYTSSDNSEGVWKAPANVTIQNVIAPAVKIDSEMQQDLNVPTSGKSICAIRAFAGRGNLVWGARTLDGNSNDWRYINVRRTIIFIEQSIKDATKAYVFAPNDASTWETVRSMISSFLTGLWNQGGLVGPKPTDAFSVNIGLGSTMTNYDIQQGIMRVAVKVALSHPAEFIEITFQQQMQKA